jgi:hypothetical protein
MTNLRRRTPAEQTELSVQLMPLFDALDPRVRRRLCDVDVDIVDLIEIAKLPPDYVLQLIDQWEAHDRANATYAY